LNYRSLASKKDRAKAAEQALNRTVDAILRAAPEVLPEIADQEPVETQTGALPEQASLARRDLQFDFRGEPWTVRIQLTDDPAESEWLSFSESNSATGVADSIDIRLSMTHPFMVTFAQTEAEDIEPLLRLAAALALSERLARRAGVKHAGTVRRNVNQILREALSQL
jgi:hypothetical protein